MKTLKTKIFIIITVAVLVIGLILFGIFGFNNTVDYRKSTEVTVSVDSNVTDPEEKMKSVSEEYFEKVGVSDVAYAFQQTEDGTLIFKFAGDITVIDAAQLKSEIEAEIGNGLVITVTKNEVFNVTDNQIGWICLACGLAIVASFLYILIMEKLAGALSVIVSSLLSAVMFVAVMGIARIPAQPFVWVSLLFSVGFAAILSTVIVNRCNEALKNVANDGNTYVKIADDMTKESVFRIVLSFAALLIFAIALLVIAPVYVKFAGLQLIVAGMVATFVSVAWTGIVWAKVKALNKDKRARVTVKTEEEN